MGQSDEPIVGLDTPPSAGPGRANPTPRAPVAGVSTVLRRARVAGAVVACLAVGACGDGDPTGPEQLHEIAKHFARWEAVAPDSYTYAVERRCFCLATSLGPVRVTVVGGAVTERTYVETGEDVPEERAAGFPSVAGLFEVLIDGVERDAFRMDVTYDRATGVPVDLYIDYRENVADEELGFRVTEMPAG